MTKKNEKRFKKMKVEKNYNKMKKRFKKLKVEKKLKNMEKI